MLIKSNDFPKNVLFCLVKLIIFFLVNPMICPAFHLFKDEKQLSISIDGARLSRKCLLLAAVAKPTGEAAWAPPQISADYMGEASLAILEGDDEEKELEAAREAQNQYTGIGGPTQVSKASERVS